MRGRCGCWRRSLAEEIADPSQWLFLDTETTGLCGGTGTYPFLIGIAWWDAGGLEVEQFFMREHSEEHSLLVALAGANGRASGARHVQRKIVRLAAAGDALSHDAKDSACQRCERIWIFCIRREICGDCAWARCDWRNSRGTCWAGIAAADVMSELIPSIYFDFLRGGPPEPLVPIFYHNQMDLRGLAGLVGASAFGAGGRGNQMHGCV